jgi:hypothetical protein
MRALLTGVVLIAATTFAQADDDPPILKVVDAQGKIVGRLSTLAETEGVYMKIGDAVAFMPIAHRRITVNTWSASQFEWSASTYTAFPTGDCSGAPLVLYTRAGRPVTLLRQGGEVTAYIAGDVRSGASNIGSIQSSYSTTTCLKTGGSGSGYWLPQSTYSLTQHYPEPLSIRY